MFGWNVHFVAHARKREVNSCNTFDTGRTKMHLKHDSTTFKYDFIDKEGKSQFWTH